MANLRTHEKAIFENLFDRGGYVLDFTDARYSEFFREHGINIDDLKYKVNGSSKMKRLRTFWQIESDKTVGTVLLGLLKYAEIINKIDVDDRKKAIEIINALLGKQVEKELNKEDFLSKEFKNLDLSLLNIDIQFENVIKQRIEEIEKSLKSKAALAVIFLCGSTLEGLLHDKASRHPKQFNTSKAAPKNKETGQVLSLENWSLNSLIDVAFELGYIELDIKKFSHDLREFRNYIHPRFQATNKFDPDEHTAQISWKVLQASIASLSGQRKK